MLCVPAGHWRLLFNRLLDNLGHNATGLPDLVQFWPQSRRYKLIEVKGRYRFCLLNDSVIANLLLVAFWMKHGEIELLNILQIDQEDSTSLLGNSRFLAGCRYLFWYVMRSEGRRRMVCLARHDITPCSPSIETRRAFAA